MPEESDSQIENVRSKVEIWMITNMHWSLLMTRLSKMLLLTWLTKKVNENKMFWRKPSLLLFHKKMIYTVNKTEKSQASNKIVDTPKSNKTNTVKSLDKSRSTGKLTQKTQ